MKLGLGAALRAGSIDVGCPCSTGGNFAKAAAIQDVSPLLGKPSPPSSELGRERGGSGGVGGVDIRSTFQVGPNELPIGPQGLLAASS